MKRIYLTFSLLIASLWGYAQQTHPLLDKDAVAQQKWVDSIYNKMTLDEKIGQLFMVSVFSSQIGTKNTENIKELIKKYHIGGIIFSKGGPQRQAQLTNQYQAISKVPLFIAMDAEWGLAMRLDSTFAYPWNMTIGAVKNNQLIEKAGYRIGKHCNSLGVHINFAPDVDINTNPANPIIGNRSFGEDKENVATKGIAFTRGMQAAGVLANAKHFPGHGDTSKDSHKTLPTIDFTSQRIDSIELYPFKKLTQEGVASFMVGHLNVPALESENGKPSSLSHHIVTDILKTRLGFEGLIFTDALGMKGVADYLPVGEVDVAAFLAGNDVLLMPEDVAKGVQAVKKAYENQQISEERLAHSVRKILMAKYKVGLQKTPILELSQVNKGLHTLADDLLIEELFENALTVAKNDGQLLPLKNLQEQKIAYVKFGNDKGTFFEKTLKRYAQINTVKVESIPQLKKDLKPFDVVIIGLHKSDKTPWDAYQFTAEELVWLQEVAKEKRLILSVFTRPYALLDVQDISNIESIVVAYQNHRIAQEKAAQLIFGAIDARGVLPVSAHPLLPVNTGISISKIGRLAYGLPESVGLDSKRLLKIDSLAHYTIEKKMAPGMQILVAKQGKVVYRKNFGTLDYNENHPVTENTIYDLASLTKILATLPEMMKMFSQNDYNINSTFSDLLPELKNTNKANIKIINAFSHNGLLQSWIPFYLKTVTPQKKPLTAYYNTQKTDDFSVPVAKNLYMRNDYKDTIYQRIVDSDLLTKKRYLYSDLPYYLFKKYLEQKSKTSLSVLVQKDFYQMLGAYRLTYFPLQHFPLEQIAPSEVDNYFRNQMVRGYVHDQGAAMQGGVGGHAGLFGNADDVAKMMQMYLQQGYYGGHWFLQPQVVSLFNTCMFCEENNRRGLGFDKPQLSEEGPTCGCVSMSSFGHSGFTGTFTWADPEHEIVYVFLSNRTYPSAENNLLIKESIRSKIQQVIYDAIITQ
ncbi:glycoside hydrolase family 3 N-terminal domain-containing protein [Capnocytophaga canimorsus]|uniref:glycoside hydrolase family 3 N-terminal domain-containing protein n=1 Tax=Capnocytophaga canimorsus TaxID=28188 RepID=UPI00385CBF6E